MFGYGKSNHNHKTEGQTTVNQPNVAIKQASGVWKLDDSQWKLDKNITKLGKGSLYVCDWVI